nr:hypothetical protein BaRGS_023229 [Batillaria attramentaria]
MSNNLSGLSGGYAKARKVPWDGTILTIHVTSLRSDMAQNASFRQWAQKMTRRKAGDDLERSSWGSQLDFFMSCVGYAVGLGNIWRFPYLCYKNGGGIGFGMVLISLMAERVETGHEAEDFGDLGGISLKLIVLLGLSWIILFLCLLKGVETSGKVVYFMASFPYLVLVALLVRGVTLEGYMKGVEFYIVPSWDRLLDATVWREAATQIFYSLGPAFGTLITMASYNPFKHNCYRDAIVVAFINCATSIFAGFVIFSMLGYMAHATNQAVANVTEDGPGLVFVVYPEGIARMPGAAVWAFLFFFMLVSLGLDSQFAMFETVISAIVDEFPNFLRRRRTVFGLLCHLVGFLLGIPMTTKGGIWVLTLLNDYSASYSLMVVCLCELIAINYVYGNKRFCLDIKMMLGFEPNIYWRATWMVITPLSILVMIVMSGVQYAPAGLGDYKFEPWVQGVGFAIAALPVGCILVGFLVQFIRYKSIREATRPDPKWGPAKEEYRTGRYAAVNLAFVGDNGYISNGSPTTVEGDIELQRTDPEHTTQEDRKARL